MNNVKTMKLNIESNKNKRKMTIRDICYAGLFTAVIAIMAQISIPMPLGVPMTMQTFAVTLAAVILGSRLSALSSFVYVMLGAIGIPVLANFTGGFERLIGPTGGFLISFPIMAFIIGLGVEQRKKFKGAYIIALILGTFLNYFIGVVMFCILTSSTASTGISACVIPFIPTAIIKAILASVIGFKIRKRINI